MHGQWQQYISFVTWVTRGFTQRQQHHKKSIRLDMAMIPNHPCNRINHESFREKKLSKLHLSGNSLMFQCHSNQYRKLFTYLTDTMKMYESLFYWRLWFIPPPLHSLAPYSDIQFLPPLLGSYQMRNCFQSNMPLAFVTNAKCMYFLRIFDENKTRYYTIKKIWKWRGKRS